MKLTAIPAVAEIGWLVTLGEAVSLIALLVVRELLQTTGHESLAARKAWTAVLIPLLAIFAGTVTARIIYVG